MHLRFRHAHHETKDSLPSLGSWGRTLCPFTGLDSSLLYTVSLDTNWSQVLPVCLLGHFLLPFLVATSNDMYYPGVSCLRGRKCFLFNDALNTFYLWLYGVRHMVKDHSDSKKGNPLPPHRLLLSINSKGSFIGTIPQTG